MKKLSEAIKDLLKEYDRAIMSKETWNCLNIAYLLAKQLEEAPTAQ